jgi:hypothetical protein
MKYTPGWSVGYYFIPILMLWKPYQALKETFQASHPKFKENWHQAAAPRLLPFWWTMWLISSFFGQITLLTTLEAETVEEWLTLSWVNLISGLIDIPLGIVMLLLVSTLAAWQTEKHDKLCQQSLNPYETLQPTPLRSASEF